MFSPLLSPFFSHILNRKQPMVNVQFFLHPLVSEGPNGEDDIGEHWLDGERPLRWEEEDLWRRIPGGPREEEGASRTSREEVPVQTQRNYQNARRDDS